MDLAEVVQWISIGRKTGSLTFVKNKTRNYIYFHDGVVISSSSNEPSKFLGQFLLFQGKISEAELKSAMELQQKKKINLAKALVQAGFVTQEDIEQALRMRTEEVIYDLFLWEDGMFHFTRDGYNIDDLVQIHIDINGILFEAARRKDEWTRIREVFPNNNVILGLRGETIIRRTILTPMKKKLLFLVNQGKTIADIILELHGSDFLVNFELFQLYQSGILEVKEVGEAIEEEEEKPDLLARGQDLMKARKFREALASFQEVLKTNPQNFEASQAIEKAEQEVTQELYASYLHPSKVPYFLVQEMALSKYNLTHEEGFVASRINGAWDIKSIVMLSPLRELDILIILDKLIKLKVIALK